MDRRGEISSGQLALLILAIVGFAIAGMFLFGITGNKDLTERDLCRLSIISRATVPGIAQQAVPLNCFTEKVCITADNGGFLGIGGKDNSCKQFAGEKNVRTVKVSLDGLGNQENAKEAIQREVANSMFDCWMMTGQGKMDIFKSGYSASKGIPEQLTGEVTSSLGLTALEIKPQCIVCSRVAFSDVLIEVDKDSGGKSQFLKDIDYNNFMSREKVPGSSLTYFQAFTDEGVGSGYGVLSQNDDKLKEYKDKIKLESGDADKIKAILLEQFPLERDKIEKLNEDNLLPYIKALFAKSINKDNQIAIVFTQIKVPSIPGGDQFWSTLSNGAIIGATGMISGPGKIVSWFIPGPGWVKVVVELAAIGATSTKLAFDAEGATRANQALSATTCGKFESKISSEPQQGCSLVKLVNWDVDTINTLCMGGIEGNL